MKATLLKKYSRSCDWRYRYDCAHVNQCELLFLFLYQINLFIIPITKNPQSNEMKMYCTMWREKNIRTVSTQKILWWLCSVTKKRWDEMRHISCSSLFFWSDKNLGSIHPENHEAYKYVLTFPFQEKAKLIKPILFFPLLIPTWNKPTNAWYLRYIYFESAGVNSVFFSYKSNEQ